MCIRDSPTTQEASVFPSLAVGSCRCQRRPRGWTQEAIITTTNQGSIKPASWSYAESFVAEDEVLAAARARAEAVGVSPIGSGGGAALQFLASVLEGRAVVEIGPCTGVSRLWLLLGTGTAG